MRHFFYLIIAALFLSSCGVKYKTIPYFTDLQNDAIVQEVIKNQTVLKIQKDDILAITVSSLNPEASAMFNFGNTSSINPNNPTVNTPTTEYNAANGFLVDSDGNIQFPKIGNIKVQGLSTASARELIQLKLQEYLKEPVVGLRIINFKISVLGDVLRPGVFPVNSERVNISEALSMAGDLNITAIRNNVLLIREQDGKRQYIRLNLQNKNVISSPYYYLQNNDVLYVQPGSAKYASVDSSYRNVSLVISALSVIALLITRF